MSLFQSSMLQLLSCNKLNKLQKTLKEKTDWKQIPTCVKSGQREAEFWPTHVIPVTVILCEVDLKPVGKGRICQVVGTD